MGLSISPFLAGDWETHYLLSCSESEVSIDFFRRNAPTAEVAVACGVVVVLGLVKVK